MFEGYYGNPAAGIRQEIHTCFMWRLRCLRCVYRFVRGRVILLLVLDDEVGWRNSAAGLRNVYRKELGYGIRDTWDDLVGAIQEIAPTTLEGVNQRVIELSSTVDQEDEIIYSQLDDARYDRALLRARVNRLDSSRPWCYRLVSELLKADYRRQRQLVETLKIVKSLKAQMTELQRQQGPAKDPAEPELPEEARGEKEEIECDGQDVKKDVKDEIEIARAALIQQEIGSDDVVHGFKDVKSLSFKRISVCNIVSDNDDSVADGNNSKVGKVNCISNVIVVNVNANS
ncbi:hypothetical protein Tco_0080297 [Tanacetum coccineum]